MFVVTRIMLGVVCFLCGLVVAAFLARFMVAAWVCVVRKDGVRLAFFDNWKVYSQDSALFVV